MKGEIKFRKMEHEAFVELLNAPGCNYWSWGGTPCYANNHELLNERCTVNLFKASIETLFNRLLSIKAKTLLASKSDAEMKEFIAVHLLKEVLLQSGAV
jgi:shikimate kinase